MNNPKNLLKSGRDKFLSNVFLALQKLENEINVTQEKQNQLQRIIDAHFQSLNERITNSGIIATAEHEIVVKIFNGLKIFLDTRDISVALHLALDRIWEPEITKAWLSVISKNDTIMDIGANFGYFGLLAAHKTEKKKSKIILFEANPHLIEYIQKTMSLNWYNEHTLIENMAVSNTKGKLKLNILEDYIGSSSIQTIDKLQNYMGTKMHLELAEAISVNSISIDEYCQKNNIKSIDLIKMDIEGHEDKAYEGMKEIIKSSPSLTLFIEFTVDAYSRPKEFYKRLVNDFRYVYKINTQGDLVLQQDTTYENIIGDADDWVMPVFSQKKLV